MIRGKLDLLWTRVESAKLQLDLAHSYVKEIVEDTSLSSADGPYAHKRVLQGEEVAVRNYFRYPA